MAEFGELSGFSGPVSLADQQTEVLPGIPEPFAEVSRVIAASLGYRVYFETSVDIGTFATTYDPDTQGIKVSLSPSLVERAESSEQMDLLCFAIAHELGHVKDLHDNPSYRRESGSKKDRFFNNIIDDIAINYSLMGKTRYFANYIPEAYETVLFTREVRENLAQKPRHQQFMEGLLSLSMIDPEASLDDFSGAQLAEALERYSIVLDPSVTEALARVVEHQTSEGAFNLLRVLRTYGNDYQQRSATATVIRKLFDQLYEEDKTEADQKGGEQDYDYSQDAGCSHDRSINPTNQDAAQQSTDKRDAETGSSQNATDQTGEPTQTKPQDDQGIQEIASQIAQVIEKTRVDGERARAEAEAEAKRAEEKARLAKLQQELGLDDNNFAGYLQTRAKYASEIQAFARLISLLKRERADAFLAPSRESSHHGHKIDVSRLVGFIASGATSAHPDIFKSPNLKEKIEYKFDGLDMFMLCDISQSMSGAKARAAAGSFVTILEGLMQADGAAGSEDLIRVQIQAFGNTNYTVTSLTARPTARDLGRTYAKIIAPKENTYVGKSLEEVANAMQAQADLRKPNRLKVVSVISDGDFKDVDLAKKQAQRIVDSGGIILQFVYGDQSVTSLGDKAIVIKLHDATSLPQKLFETMPDLLNILRSQPHA